MNIEIANHAALDLLNQADKRGDSYSYIRETSSPGSASSIRLTPVSRSGFPLPHFMLLRDGTYRASIAVDTPTQGDAK